MNGLAGLAASRIVFRFCGLVLAAITLAPPLAFGGVNRWTSSGSLGTGTSVDSLAIDPVNPETAYAGTGSAVLKSRDGGLSWTTSLQVPSDAPFIGGLAIDPASPSNVYAGTKAGIFKSVDAGGSWHAVGPSLSDARVFSLAIDPSAPSHVFAGTAGGLFKSTDGGGSWNGKLLAASIYSLVFSHQEPSTIFGAEFNGGFYYPDPSNVFKSTDDGATATQSVSPTAIPPGALAIDPTNPSTLYSGGIRGHGFNPSGLYKTVDSGLTWRLVNDGSDVVAVVIDPKNPSTVYAATLSGFIQSTDGGASWREFNTGLNGHVSVSALTTDQTGTRLLAGTNGGEVLSYQISIFGRSDLSAALDLSVGTDNKTRVLFNDPDNRALFRNFDSSGQSASNGPNGPYSGWRPRAVADGADGLTRVLWNNLDGSAALWLMGPTGNQASYRFGPMAGWTALDVSVGSDTTTHLLWTNIDGRTRLTSVAVSGAVVGDTTYGPYSGWIARSISDGADGLTRVLWSNNDGRVGLSLVDAGRIVTTYRLAPGPGWTALDVAVSADNKTRILFVNANGGIVLWSVDNSGAVTDSGTVYAPPATGGRAAVRISAGADGLTRVLWANPEGIGSLWLMGLDNVLQNSFDFCGSSGESVGCGTWDY